MVSSAASSWTWSSVPAMEISQEQAAVGSTTGLPFQQPPHAKKTAFCWSWTLCMLACQANSGGRAAELLLHVTLPKRNNELREATVPRCDDAGKERHRNFSRLKLCGEEKGKPTVD
ncbi:hypothetical protein GUJ93_ZPchr0011g27056 [Zizania palustris]|uniref:Uncharacterized protein n=1 Tax=Zizania palustris TaxID=103762 RepID=A0A8J6BPE8_ZIZPA|nr:hypothetical protein GUJ93_ZPchr0011g27056 [Zizania palustris]